MTDVSLIERLFKVIEKTTPRPLESYEDLKLYLKYSPKYKSLKFEIVSCELDFKTWVSSVKVRSFKKKSYVEVIEGDVSGMLPKGVSYPLPTTIDKETAVTLFERINAFHETPAYRLSDLELPGLSQATFEAIIEGKPLVDFEWTREDKVEVSKKYSNDENLLIRFEYAKFHGFCTMPDVEGHSDKTHRYYYGPVKLVREILMYVEVFLYAFENVSPTKALRVDHLPGARLMFDDPNDREIWCYLAEHELRLVEFEDKLLIVSNSKEY